MNLWFELLLIVVHLDARMRNITKKRAMAIKAAMMTFLIRPKKSGSSILGKPRPKPDKVSPQPRPTVGFLSTGL